MGSFTLLGELSSFVAGVQRGWLQGTKKKDSLDAKRGRNCWYISFDRGLPLPDAGHPWSYGRSRGREGRNEHKHVASS